MTLSGPFDPAHLHRPGGAGLATRRVESHFTKPSFEDMEALETELEAAFKMPPACAVSKIEQTIPLVRVGGRSHESASTGKDSRALSRGRSRIAATNSKHAVDEGHEQGLHA